MVLKRGFKASDYPEVVFAFKLMVYVENLPALFSL